MIFVFYSTEVSIMVSYFTLLTLFKFTNFSRIYHQRYKGVYPNRKIKDKKKAHSSFLLIHGLHVPVYAGLVLMWIATIA